MPDLTGGKESYFQHEFFHWILTTGFDLKDFKSDTWTSMASALYLWKQRGDEALLVLLNPQTSRAKSCSEMHQAPIAKAVAFSLTPVRASPGAQPSEEERGESLHLSAFHPGLLLSPVAAADINKYKVHRGFVCRWGDLQDLLKPDYPKVWGLYPTWGSNICVAETPTNFFFNFTAHTRDVVPRMLCI